MLSPALIAVWASLAQMLIPIVDNAVQKVKGWFHQAHGAALTDEQLQAAWDAVLADDRVRLAIAKAAGGIA